MIKRKDAALEIGYEHPYEHPFSWKALFRIILAGLLVLLAWKALGVFVDILIALILAAAYYPVTAKLKTKLPNLFATILAFLFLLVPFALIGVFIIPTLVKEFSSFTDTFHAILSNLTFLPDAVRSFNISTYLTQHASTLIASTPAAILGIISAGAVYFLMFYFSLDYERLLEFFLDLFPRREHDKIKGMLAEVARVNGQYIRGNLFISLICAAILFTGLVILRVPFALPLALFAGTMDLLPLIGSTLGSIPALIISFSISPLTGLAVLILHLLYQQAENAIISPAIYNKALNISPALSFLSVLIGAGLFGILGAFLALPVAASIPSMVRYANDYSHRHHHSLMEDN